MADGTTSQHVADRVSTLEEELRVAHVECDRVRSEARLAHDRHIAAETRAQTAERRLAEAVDALAELRAKEGTGTNSARALPDQQENERRIAELAAERDAAATARDEAIMARDVAERDRAAAEEALQRTMQDLTREGEAAKTESETLRQRLESLQSELTTSEEALQAMLTEKEEIERRLAEAEEGAATPEPEVAITAVRKMLADSGVQLAENLRRVKELGVTIKQIVAWFGRRDSFLRDLASGKTTPDLCDIEDFCRLKPGATPAEFVGLCTRQLEDGELAAIFGLELESEGAS